MIKLSGHKKGGYWLSFTNWIDYEKHTPHRIPLTYFELMAIMKLLRKHFSLEELNYHRKQAGQSLIKRKYETNKRTTA